MTSTHLRHVYLCVLLAASFAPEAGAQRIKRAPDAAPPAIRIVQPAPGGRIVTFTPEIELEYDDEGAAWRLCRLKQAGNGVATEIATK